MIRPGSQLVVQFLPKVFNGVEVRAVCRPVKFFHTDLVKLKRERVFPKLLLHIWKHRIV